MVDGMSVSDAASWIGVPPDTLSRVLDGREGISPDLASRLEAAGWSRRKLWLRLQAAYDEAQAQLRDDHLERARGTSCCSRNCIGRFYLERVLEPEFSSHWTDRECCSSGIREPGAFDGSLEDAARGAKATEERLGAVTALCRDLSDHTRSERYL